MSDERLRELERRVDAGDPEAKAQLERQVCRTGVHSWTVYKGGAPFCRGCGTTGEVRERALGDMTIGPDSEINDWYREQLRLHLQRLEDDGE
ncbi:MAG: hypothetical protein R3F62_05010 [Planctomycetota bacterium]